MKKSRYLLLHLVIILFLSWLGMKYEISYMKYIMIGYVVIVMLIPSFYPVVKMYRIFNKGKNQYNQLLENELNDDPGFQKEVLYSRNMQNELSKIFLVQDYVANMEIFSESEQLIMKRAYEVKDSVRQNLEQLGLFSYGRKNNQK